jgi:hypothetical protein
MGIITLWRCASIATLADKDFFHHFINKAHQQVAYNMKEKLVVIAIRRDFSSEEKKGTVAKNYIIIDIVCEINGNAESGIFELTEKFRINNQYLLDKQRRISDITSTDAGEDRACGLSGD